MSIREVRILIEWQKSIRKLCKIAFSSTDASLYLFPYASQGYYYSGSKTMPEQHGSQTFNFTEDIFQANTPKLSIHESGQIHVSMGGKKVGPLFVPALETLTGQHIASVSPDAFDALPVFKGTVRNTASEADHIIPADDDAINGRLALYVNGFKPLFACTDCRLTFNLSRSTISRPLYIGIKPIGQPLISVDSPKGVTIIAGWDPQKPKDKELDYLYIRGE